MFKKYTVNVYYDDGSFKNYHVVSYNRALKKRNKLQKNKNCRVIIYVYPIPKIKCE